MKTCNFWEAKQFLELIPVLNHVGKSSKLGCPAEIIKCVFFLHPGRFVCDIG